MSSFKSKKNRGPSILFYIIHKRKRITFFYFVTELLPPVDAVPPVPEVRVPEEVWPVVEVESKTDEVKIVDAVDSPKEDIVVERPVDIEPAADELPRELEEESTLTTLQPGLPGSFPTSPSKASATLPADVAPSSAASTESSSTTKIPQVRVAIPTSNRIRTPRSVIDIVVAMQLCPGLGAGAADPAWMVRFLMAMFGWLRAKYSRQRGSLVVVFGFE